MNTPVNTPVNIPVKILVLQHGDDDPPLRLGEWLVEAGAELDVRRCHRGDPVPQDVGEHDAVISLGGEMSAYDDEVAPWLPAVRRRLAAAVTAEQATWGICLGAQLLAVATGGSVIKGPDGPEIGAYLIAKRDAADADPLCADLPLTPDVAHYHYDVVDRLPPGATLLYSSTGYPNQFFRVGRCAWGSQFHPEVTAEVVRGWALAEGRPLTARLGEVLDEAEGQMAVVWRHAARRFVQQAQQTGALPGRRLPLTAAEES